MSHYSSSIERTVTSAINRTFAWMALGLFLTAIFAYYISASHFYLYLINPRGGISGLGIIFMLLPLALTFLLQFAYDKFSYSAMVAWFLTVTSAHGITLSTIFLVYEMSSIIGVFFIAAGIFLSMAIYGLVTKHNLSNLGMFATMVLFGVIIIQLINMFMRSNALSMGIAFISVIIFSALTAYDIQNIRSILSEMAYNNEEREKMSIFGAFQMYINFLNIFLNLLRLLGNKKRD